MEYLYQELEAACNEAQLLKQQVRDLENMLMQNKTILPLTSLLTMPNSKTPCNTSNKHSINSKSTIMPSNNNKKQLNPTLHKTIVQCKINRLAMKLKCKKFNIPFPTSIIISNLFRDNQKITIAGTASYSQQINARIAS